MKNHKCFASNESLKEFSPLKSERAVQLGLTRLEKEWCIKRDFKNPDHPRSGRMEIKCLVVIDHSNHEQVIADVRTTHHHISNIYKEKDNTGNNELLQYDSLNSSLPVNDGDVITNPEKDEQVKQIIDIFNKHNPAVVYKNNTHRKAVEDLINEYGVSNVINMAQTAISVQGKKFAPLITNPYDLFNKLPKLEYYLNN